MNDETKFEMRELARDDLRRAALLGLDRNVFTTPGARDEWERGFNGQPSAVSVDSRAWWRGHFARELQAQHSDTSSIQRARAYGVQFIPKDGKWYAWHIKAGATPLYATQQDAAVDACIRWDL